MRYYLIFMLVFAKCLNSIPLEFNQANGQKTMKLFLVFLKE